MPFGLANAPATFQAYINEALTGLLDHICVAYMDDIMVFSENPVDHSKHVRMVLERLRKFQLYANPAKCSFNTTSVEFLGFVVDTNGVRMEEGRVATVRD